LSCSNQYYYAANSLDSTLSLFLVTNTEALSAPTAPTPATYPTGQTPTSVVAGRYTDGSSDELYTIYTGNAGAGTISQFSVDCSTGTLTSLGKDVTLGAAPAALLFQSLPLNNGFPGVLYASSSLGVSGYSIAVGYGPVTPTFGFIDSAVPGSPAAAGTNPGALGGYQQNAYPTVTTTQGSVNVTLATASEAVVPYMQVVSGTGITPGTYIVSVKDTAVTLSAAATASGTVTVGLTAKFVYVLNVGDNTVSTFIINPGTGALVSVGNPVPTGKSPSAILFTARPNYNTT
jgi:hypothetical protein